MPLGLVGVGVGVGAGSGVGAGVGAGAVVVLETLIVVETELVLPAPSEAGAVRVWEPLLTLVESKMQFQGESDSVLSLVPSTLKTTPSMPLGSLALISQVESWILPDTVAPAVGTF